MKKILLCISLFFNLLFIAQHVFGQNQTLTAEVRNQTIDDLSSLLPERYAYKEIGQELAGLLEQNLKVGKYNVYKSPMDFNLAIMSDLRSLNAD